jgi:hypothetical protein
MMKQDKSLKDTTLACSCNSGSVYCVYVTGNKYIKKKSRIAVYAFYHTCKTATCFDSTYVSKNQGK